MNLLKILKCLIRDVTWELLDLMGRFDPSLSAQLAALYQSCSLAVEAEQIIEKSSADPKASLLVGFFNQIKFYKNLNISHNVFSSPLVRSLLDATKSRFASAFKFLTTSTNHFNLSKELPPNTTVVILQHNLAKTELLAAVLDASKQGSNSTGKASRLQTQANSNSTSKSKTTVFKVSTDPFQLYHLQQLWREWKSSLQAFNLKIEFQLDNDLIKKNVGSSLLEHSEGISELMKLYLNPNNPVNFLNFFFSKVSFLNHL